MSRGRATLNPQWSNLPLHFPTLSRYLHAFHNNPTTDRRACAATLTPIYPRNIVLSTSATFVHRGFPLYLVYRSAYTFSIEPVIHPISTQLCNTGRERQNILSQSPKFLKAGASGMVVNAPYGHSPNSAAIVGNAFVRLDWFFHPMVSFVLKVCELFIT
jgi:hypothetical protein